MKTATRLTLIFGLAAAVIGGGVMFVRHNQDNSDDESPNKLTDRVAQPLKRPAVEPTNVFSANLTRMNLPQLPLVGINDKGDVLFVRNKETQDYDLISAGKTTPQKASAPNVDCYLTPVGQVHQMLEVMVRPTTEVTLFPYNDSSEFPKFFDDGSMLVERKVVDITISEDGKEHVSEQSAITRESHTADKIAPIKKGGGMPVANFGGPRSSTQVKTRLPGSMGVSAGSPENYFDRVASTTELYRSRNVVRILAKDDKEVIWFAERKPGIGNLPESLIKLVSLKPEIVKLPDGYTNIHRVASTNGQLAATFGVLNGRQPFRAFALEGENWRELPVPAGFDCSVAQNMLSNGLILGFVSTWDGKKVKEVVWKGTEMCILSDLPAWPKQGELSLVVGTNRRGEFCVRNITNLATGASDYYMMSVAL